ncbi:hypothetical protein EUTSA_v10012084mg, partial [Eutrema salsugineum]
MEPRSRYSHIYKNSIERSRYFPRFKPVCRLSDPANPHKLCRRSNPPLSVCFACKGQHLNRLKYYYYCAICDLEFHRGCHLSPPEIKHPFHLLHPLNIKIPDPDYDVSSIPNDWNSDSSDSDYFEVGGSEDDEDPVSDGNHVKCNSCRKNLYGEYYHCSVCNFSLHFICALNPPPLTIENLKTHDHTLTLFPRRVPLPCDACGFSLEASFDPVYSCLLCNYMVHKKCTNLPRVIKITRHPHRLSHTSSLVPSSSGELFTCGVCRKPVDINYGQFSCNKGCHYAVHSKCATKFQVWDGIDLEGVPEEEEEVLEPFLRIDEETIQHFTHDHHHLKIQGNDNPSNHENKFCQACILPMTVSDRFYSCIDCDYVLHETCASLPRKQCHPLHRHSLNLFHLDNPRQELDEAEEEYSYSGFFKCNGCSRLCCGFMYKCTEKDCKFQLDARCASLPDPVIHDCHPHDHPFFFTLNRGECIGCKSNRGHSSKYLECIECNSFLCLYCATLPTVAHYKHDKHPLTLCCGEEKTKDLPYWCEFCESKLDATKWFYTCNSCSVTLHVTCLLGKKALYMKPNHLIRYHRDAFIKRNSGNSRPVCDRCKRRCIDTV